MSKSWLWDWHPYETGGKTRQEWFSTKDSWFTRVKTVAPKAYLETFLKKVSLKKDSWRVSILSAGFTHLQPFSFWHSHLLAGRLRDQLYCLRPWPGELRVLSLAVVISRCPELGKLMVIPPLLLQKLYSLVFSIQGYHRPDTTSIQFTSLDIPLKSANRHSFSQQGLIKFMVTPLS